MNRFKWLTKNLVLSVRDCLDGAKTKTEQKMLMLARILDFPFLTTRASQHAAFALPEIRLSRGHNL